MYRDITEREIIEKGRRDIWWRHDRNDTYKYQGEKRTPCSFSVRVFYVLDEAHCNPDFDW